MSFNRLKVSMLVIENQTENLDKNRLCFTRILSKRQNLWITDLRAAAPGKQTTKMNNSITEITVCYICEDGFLLRTQPNKLLYRCLVVHGCSNRSNRPKNAGKKISAPTFVCG